MTDPIGYWPDPQPYIQHPPGTAAVDALGNDKGPIYAALRRVAALLDEAVLSGALTAEERRVVRISAAPEVPA